MFSIRHYVLSQIILLFFIPTLSWGNVIDTYRFKSVEHQQLAYHIVKELRCIQCQNQNLLESVSPLAQNMRLMVYQWVEQGKSKRDIRALMHQRYGDFVLYEPVFSWHTYFLWFAPFILLFISLAAVVIKIKKVNKADEQDTF